MAILAVCIASPWRLFRSRRRIGTKIQTGRPEVILIRGAALGIYPYWPCVENLARRFRAHGYAATVINHFEYPRVANEITRAIRKGRLPHGVALVGYSFGSDTASLFAEILQQASISVETMVLIESTWGTPVPGNVKNCVNYFKSRELDWIPSSRGVAVAARDSRTHLTNINVRNHSQLADTASRNHFTMGDDPLLHDLAVEFVQTKQLPSFIDTYSSPAATPRAA